MLPDGSMVIAYGPDPVVPNVLEAPLGVILVTLLETLFTIYKLPAESLVIPNEETPAVLKLLDLPSKVILLTFPAFDIV